MVASLVNPNNPLTEAVLTDVQAAATVTGHQIQVVNASDEGEIDKAFATLKELHVDALIVGADPYFFTRNDQLVALAARYAIPAFYELREFAVNGGLMSYGASIIGHLSDWQLELLVLMFVTYLPEVSLWLPRRVLR
ncbi:hypothetical protein [Bradyrhizobium sp.]|uniref:hypothetical protein n=1 Tax=Bradyrhizobium sp. TaxID=376 RepID=UPI003C78D112